MKKYQFYGWEQADVPATSKTYEKIKNPKECVGSLFNRCCKTSIRFNTIILKKQRPNTIHYKE